MVAGMCVCVCVCGWQDSIHSSTSLHNIHYIQDLVYICVWKGCEASHHDGTHCMTFAVGRAGGSGG